MLINIFFIDNSINDQDFDDVLYSTGSVTIMISITYESEYRIIFNQTFEMIFSTHTHKHTCMHDVF